MLERLEKHRRRTISHAATIAKIERNAKIQRTQPGAVERPAKGLSTIPVSQESVIVRSGNGRRTNFVFRQDVQIPRSHRPDGSPSSGSSLGSYIGAHPWLMATSAVVVGASAITGLAQGATLDATLPANFNDTNVARNRSIVFIGMNEDSRYEVQGLVNALGGNQSAVTYIHNTKNNPDVVKIGNTSYDLKTDEGRAAFVEKLGLRGDRADALKALLAETGDNARDELGQLARVYAEAERGERFIERLVLSGHSVGSGIWGDGNGSLSYSYLAKLNAIFPTAAGQVQDLMIAACYNGGEERLDQHRTMFPNVKTIWAYDGSAPGSVSGAVPHLTRWERGTRGESTDRLTRDAAANTRKGENVAVWTVTRGYSNGQPPRELSEVRETYNATRGVVEQFRSGEQSVENPGEGPLRQHYNNIHRLLGRRDLPAQERADLQAERDLVIRLLYYKNVSGLFQVNNTTAISRGFAEVGLDAPDFGRMSRKEALEVIARFDAAVAAKGNVSRNVQYLSEILHGGLQDLKPQYIPDAWL